MRLTGKSRRARICSAGLPQTESSLSSQRLSSEATPCRACKEEWQLSIEGIEGTEGTAESGAGNSGESLPLQDNTSFPKRSIFHGLVHVHPFKWTISMAANQRPPGCLSHLCLLEPR